MTTIAIVGAGLMGRLLALFLHRQGVQITLIDKDNKAAHNSAAYAAAGLLTPLGEALHCQRNIVDMGFAAIKKWPAILSTLSAYTFFQQSGTIAVSHAQDQGNFQHFKRFLANNYPQYSQQILDRSALLTLEPELARHFNQGLFLPDEGQIGNRKLLVALRKQLEIEQITWLSDCEVSAIAHTTSGASVTFKHHGEHFTTHLSTPSTTGKSHHQQQTFDLVIDCRGIGAQCQGLNQQDPSKLTDLRAVRGELFQLFAPDVALSRPIRLMHPRYQLYIAPKGKGHYVVGATEIESDDKAAMTVRSAMELLSAAYSVHPGFAEANIRQHISQLRPAFSDNQPKIITQGALMQINGLYRHGFLLAPILLEQALTQVKAMLGAQVPASKVVVTNNHIVTGSSINL